MEHIVCGIGNLTRKDSIRMIDDASGFGFVQQIPHFDEGVRRLIPNALFKCLLKRSAAECH